MNLVAFVDELVKVGAMKCLYKRADDGDVNTADAPHGMMSHDPMPESIRLNPAQVGTRLPRTAAGPATITAGELGSVATARNPIDREKHNRAYKDRR
jgi:hypothetical protein